LQAALFAGRFPQGCVDAILPAGTLFLKKVEDVLIRSVTVCFTCGSAGAAFAGSSGGLVVAVLNAFSAAARVSDMGRRDINLSLETSPVLRNVRF